MRLRQLTVVAALLPLRAVPAHAEAGRTPTPHTKIDSARAADHRVAREAGAGRLP